MSRQTNLDSLFPQMPRELRIHDGSFLSEWCCDCNLCHIKFFRVELDEESDEPVIVMRCERDDVATELRRFYEKEMKKRRKANKEL